MKNRTAEKEKIDRENYFVLQLACKYREDLEDALEEERRLK